MSIVQEREKAKQDMQSYKGENMDEQKSKDEHDYLKNKEYGEAGKTEMQMILE